MPIAHERGSQRKSHFTCLTADTALSVRAALWKWNRPGWSFISSVIHPSLFIAPIRCPSIVGCPFWIWKISINATEPFQRKTRPFCLRGGQPSSLAGRILPRRNVVEKVHHFQTKLYTSQSKADTFETNLNILQIKTRASQFEPDTLRGSK